MPVTEVFVAIIGIIGIIISGIVSWWGAKRYKIGPNQERLVATLKDLVAAQQLRIEELERQAELNKAHIAELTKKVATLEALTVSQALIIKQLSEKKA
jgi:Na+/glutamate symporter